MESQTQTTSRVAKIEDEVETPVLNTKTKETSNDTNTNKVEDAEESKREVEESEETKRKFNESKEMLIIAYAQGLLTKKFTNEAISKICECLISDTTDDEKVKEIRKLRLKQKTIKNYNDIGDTSAVTNLNQAQIDFLRENTRECMFSVIQFTDDMIDFNEKMAAISNILRSDSAPAKKVEKISDILL